jgi:hypothetical protein|tara:strand:- start:97 stop:1533 length:1437 start_codon:yes stop_codon:yes gene_type:complete
MAKQNKNVRRRKAGRPNVIDISTLLREYAPNGNGLYVDNSIQRRTTAWHKDSPQEYIVSILDGGESMPLFYADIESGKKAEKRGTAGYNQYVTASENGANSFVSLDGLQRTTALLGFINGDFGVTGDFTDAWGGVHNLKNAYYHRLPETLRMTFDTTPMLIIVFSHYRYLELPVLFRRINSGEALNRMERRNSYFSPIAAFMRNMSETPEAIAFWRNLQGATKVGRMKDIDRLCNLAIYTIGNYRDTCPSNNTDALINAKPTDTVKDTLYSIGEGHLGFGSPSPYDESEMYRFRLIFELTLDIISTQKEFGIWSNKSGLPVYSFQALFFFVKELISRNLMIANSLSDIDVSSANTVVRQVSTWHRNMKNSDLARYSADNDAWTRAEAANDEAVTLGTMTKEERNAVALPEVVENLYYQQYHMYVSGVKNRQRFERDIKILVDEMIADNSVAFFDVEKDIDLYVNSSTLEGMKTVLQVA